MCIRDSIVGESELAANKMTLKNMLTGEQQLVSVDQAAALLK